MTSPSFLPSACSSAALRLGSGILTIGEASPIVNIPDPNLRAALEQALGKNEGDVITKEDLTKLGQLSDLGDLGITDLTGLEYCINLTSLWP